MSFFKNRDQEILEELKKFDKHLENFEQHIHDDLQEYVKPIADLLSDLRKHFVTVNDNINDLNKQFQNLAINHLAERIQNDVRFQHKVLGKKKDSTIGLQSGSEDSAVGLKPVNVAIQLAKHKYAHYTKAQKAKIFALLDAGQMPTPIAKKLNIPVSYVYYMQKENRKNKDTNGTGKAS